MLFGAKPEPLEDSANSDEIPLAPDVFPGDALDGAEIVGADAATRADAEKHGLRVLAVLSALMGFASISTDFYLPALPTMAMALHSDQSTIALTISGYLVGFSAGQLIWGPIGDRYGRRIPVAVGIVLFIIGSAGCALSGSPFVMIGWRLVQAIGACAGVVLARAMVRDLYAGNRAAQMLSTLMTVMAIAPLLGPILGGQILAVAGWRAIFWTLVGLGAATLASLLVLPETLPPQKRNTAPLIQTFSRSRELLRDRRLLGYAGVGGFFYGGIYAYIAGTPFAYIDYYRVTPQVYGLLFGTGIIGIMGANIINSRLVHRFGSGRILVWGAIITAISGVTLALTARTGLGGLTGLVVPLFLFVGSNGFIVANSIAGALSGYPKQAGTVSALVGSIHYSCGIVSSALVGALADGTPWPMGLIIALCGLGCLASAQLLSPAKTSR